jgi:hypothetical protein
MFTPKNLKDQIRNLGNLGQEAKKKAQQHRLDDFKVAVEQLEEQYGCFTDAILQATPKGIIPIVTVNAIPEDEFQRLKEQREQRAATPDTPAGPASHEAGNVAEAPQAPAQS